MKCGDLVYDFGWCDAEYLVFQDMVQSFPIIEEGCTHTIAAVEPFDDFGDIQATLHV